jgi:hypothetical protein
MACGASVRNNLDQCFSTFSLCPSLPFMYLYGPSPSQTRLLVKNLPYMQGATQKVLIQQL